MNTNNNNTPQHNTQDEQNILSQGQLFLEMMAAHKDDIRIDRVTLEICGDLAAAAVLSKIAYWFSPSKKDGQKRLRVFKEGKHWLAKTDEQWWEECGVTGRQMKRIRKTLQDLGLIDIEHWMFAGMRTCHYHLNLDTYLKMYADKVKEKITVSTKGADRSVPKVPTDQDQTYRPITMSTTSSTSMTTKDNVLDSASVSKKQKKSIERTVAKFEPVEMAVYHRILRTIPEWGEPADEGAASFWITKWGHERVKEALELYWERVKEAKEAGRKVNSMGATIRTALEKGEKPKNDQFYQNKAYAEKKAKSHQCLVVTKEYVRFDSGSFQKELFYKLPHGLFVNQFESYLENSEVYTQIAN